MIRTEQVKALPQLEWTEYSAFELRSYDPAALRELVTGSRTIKIVYKDKTPVMVAGLWKGSLLATPYLWTLITPAFQTLRISELRNLVHELGVHTSEVETLVNEDKGNAIRLALLFKFHPTDMVVMIEGHAFRMYRRA